MMLANALCSACFGWGLGCGAWGTVQAQTAGGAASAAAASAPEAKMSERVLREASNPMRIILDAGKVIKRRPGEGGTALRAGATPTTVSVATAKPVAAAAVAPPDLPTTVLRAAQAATVFSQSTASSAAAAAPPVSLAPRENLTAPTGENAAPTAAPTAALSAAATAAAAEPTAAIPTSPLKLINMVSPDIPERVARRVGALTEVLVQLTILRDGTVRDISVVQPGQKAVEPYIIEALGQWRYAPISEPRTQRVQLVFNN